MKDNGLLRPFAVLVLASLIAFLLTKAEVHWDIIPNWEAKVFNPLSDILPEVELKTSNATEIAPTSLPTDVSTSIPSDEVVEVDSVAILKAEREKELAAILAAAQSVSSGLSDFSADGGAKGRLLSKFLQAREHPVYIAFLGDSFIEGDILVAPFRNKLQERFGGRGVGYVPLTSPTARFRNTIEHRFSGDWQSTTSLKPHKGDRFTISEQFQSAKGKAEASYKLPKSPANLSQVDRVTLSIQAAQSTPFTISVNGGEPQPHTINGDSTMSQLTYRTIAEGGVEAITIQFPEGLNGRLHGLFFDDHTGITVDNFSLRGSSGLQLSHVSSSLTAQMQRHRPYDLIILSYGLNVVSAEENDDTYGWYYAGMDKALTHLRQLYPEAIFLILSVSDRATIIDGEVKTLSGIAKVLLHQERLARKHGALFWNTYQRMQDGGGIEGYVSKGWAAKDYTHLSYGGGRQLAKLLLRDLIGDE